MAGEQTRSVREAIRQYAARRPELVQVTDGFVRLITAMLDDAGINYLTVTGRTKTVGSFAEKATRRVNGRRVVTDPLEQITDQIGVRVITYVRSDVDAVAELLGQELTVLDDRDLGQETADQGRWGYSSRHLLLAVDASRTLTAEQAELRTHAASVQLRTVLQHAWAEFEHDIRYKGTVPEAHVPDLNRRFTLAAGLLELADHEFSAIRERLRQTVPDDDPATDGDDPSTGADGEPLPEAIDPRALSSFLAGYFADAGWSRAEHYDWISGLLSDLGITTLDELSHVLGTVDSDQITAQMGYRYPPAAVRRLDDALLSVYGEDYVTRPGNAHRVDQLHDRLRKLA